MGGDLGYFFVFPSRGGDEGGIDFPPDRARIWEVSACLFSFPSRARIKVSALLFLPVEGEDKGGV